MSFKLLRATLCVFVLLNMVYASTALAQAEGGSEGGGNVQTPVQVIVQIVLTAIALRALAYFKLP